MKTVETSPPWFLSTEGEPSIQTKLWFKAAARIKRYEGLEMVHRWDLFDHNRRVAKMAELFGEKVYAWHNPMFRPDRAVVFRKAYHHDDEEFCTTDIPTPVKLAMTPEQKAKLELDEAIARQIIGMFILTLSPEHQKVYEQDRVDLKEEATLEDHLVKSADKVDALCEKLHEIRCGNATFIDTLDLSRKIIAGLDRFPVWKMLKYDPAIRLHKGIPDNETITRLPTIGIGSFQQRSDLITLATDGGIEEWPIIYQTWLMHKINNVLDKDLERMVYPGWREQMWQKWGIPKGAKTTPSGIRIS